MVKKFGGLISTNAFRADSRITSAVLEFVKGFGEVDADSRASKQSDPARTSDSVAHPLRQPPDQQDGGHSLSGDVVPHERSVV